MDSQAIQRDFTQDLDSEYTGLTFDSDKEAFDWARKLCKDFRFNIIRGSKMKASIISDVQLYHHYFTCECTKRSESEKKKKEKEAKKQKQAFLKVKKRVTSSKRVGCRFRGVIRMEEDGKFHVSVFVGVHDHPLVYYVEGNATYIRLNDADKAIIRQMYRGHCAPKTIVQSLQYSDDEKPFLVKPVYNYIQKIRNEGNEGRNPARQFLKLARDNNYFTRVEPVKGSNELRDMFWSHPNAQKLLTRYPSVLCIDATYGTNKYNYALIEIVGVAPTNQNFTAAQAVQHENKASYLWVMQRLAELLGPGVNPVAIVTDRELGLFEPIATVFPGSHHLLCMHHVKKMIRARAITVMDTEKEGDALFFGSVTPMLEARTEKEFVAREKDLRTKYRWVPSFMKYLDEIWLPHKEKFCLAWTNRVLHFGNNTTNRVESAHSALKDWMKSCRASLDTLFEKTLAEVESQTKEIRGRLERSRARILEGFDCSPYMELLRKVSHYCLIELQKSGVCSHAFLETHGLPCSCRLAELRGDKGHVPLDEVDPFWTRLSYDGDEVEEAQCGYNIHKMVEEYGKRGVADQVSLSRKLHAELHPEQCAFDEPEVNVKKKGRPRKRKSTRELSGYEHIQKEIDKSGKSSHGSNAMKPKIVGCNSVPIYVREYLLGTDDVNPDGNCGFRCAALRFLNSQEEYSTIRRLIASEMKAYRSVYEVVYWKEDKVKDYELALKRIDWKGRGCTSAHWMNTPCDLFAIAQIFGAVVSVYTYDKLDRNGCCTVLPWREEIGCYGKLREMSIILMGDKLHYVLGHFSLEDGSEPDNPLPMVHPLWKGIRTESLKVWTEKTYKERLERFKILQSKFMDFKASRGGKNKKKKITIVIDR